MNAIVNMVVLKSDQHYGRKSPPRALGEVLRQIPSMVRQAIRMRFEGRSSGAGKRPQWLQAMSDIRLVDYGGDEDTVLAFECPRFRDAAPELYQQKRFDWASRPDPDDTGFDLLGDVLIDVAARNADSDRYDRPLLRQLASFRAGAKASFREVGFTGIRFSPDRPAVLNEAVIATARSLSDDTPPAEPVRVVGTLDMIRASTQAFALKLDDGQEVRGVMIAGDVGQSRHLLATRVLVLGRSVYRPSGRLLRVDADEIHPASAGDRFFSRIPSPGRRRLDVKTILREQAHKRGLAAIMGKWPGDETDEEIAAALQELS